MTTTLPVKKQERTVTLDVQKEITSELISKKVYLAELINSTLKHYLQDKENLPVNNEYSIYKLPIVNEEINIIDFKINSLDVNVVVTVDREKNRNVYIPKIYKSLNYKPDIFLFVNFKKTLTKMDILGFLDDVNLNSSIIPKDNLIPAENLLDTLKTKRTKYNFTENSIIKTAQELMLGYIDNELSEDGKKFFCKYLLTSPEIRKNYKLFYAINCKFIAIVNQCDVKDYTLDIFSGKLPHPANDISLQDNIEETVENFTQEFIQPNEQENENIILDKDNILQLEETIENNTQELVQDNIEEEKEIEFQENTLLSQDIINISQEEPKEEIQPELEQTQQEIILQEEPKEEIIQENEQNEQHEQNEQNAIELSENEEIFDMNNIELQLNDDNVQNLHEEEDFDISALKDEDFIEINELKELENNENLIEENQDEMPKEEEKETISPEPIPPTSLVATDYTAIDNPTPLEQAIHESVEETQEDIFNMLSELSDNQQEDIEINSIDEDDLNYIENDSSYLDNIDSETNTSQDIDIQQKNDLSETTNTSDFAAEMSNLDMNFDENMEFLAPGQDEINARLGQNFINTALEHNVNKKHKKGLIFILLLFALAGAGLAGLGFKMFKNFSFLEFKNNDEIPKPVETTAETPQNNNIPAPATSEELPEPVTTQEDIPVPPQDKKETETIPKPNLPPVDGAPALPDAPEKPLPKIPQGVKPKQLHEVVGMAISKDYNRVRISHVWWGVPSGLDSVPVVSEYLKITGESIKSALSKSLTEATDMAQNYGVVLSITYKKDGSVVSTRMTKGSGSQQIDEIIIATVEQTLTLTKMPALKINKEEYNVELHIDL